MAFPPDYIERVYAGVLGKIIGVYLGRPVENWSCETITARYGLVDRYVNAEQGVHLVVTDDDIAGTFTFLRALEDYDFSPDLTPAQIGQTWLNYIIENRTILWWGGLFHSTEHTAYLHLKEGIPAPESGSIERNGPVIANQIGAQIYIDGWAMLFPGDPERAADFARRAASVSHDDEAVHAAQLIAAMEAQAFVESDLTRLVDAGLRQIPQDSLVRRLVDDLREWHAREDDWRRTRERIADVYGYRKYVGGCHIIPNHALIHLGLLYGGGDFLRSLAITITAGWDTDCNAGNLGCLLAIRGGLAGIPSTLREPVADRLFLPTADGGRCISDAVREAGKIVHTAHRLGGQVVTEPKRENPGDPPWRFHFSYPGSLQGWCAEEGTARVENVVGGPHGRWLAIRCPAIGAGQSARVSTATFIRPDELNMGGYAFIAAPTLYPGQMVHTDLSAAAENHSTVQVGLYLDYYDANDRPARCQGPVRILRPGEPVRLSWAVPEVGGGPIFALGVEISNPTANLPGEAGTVFLDRAGWAGAPEVVFQRPPGSSLPGPGPMLFRRAWVDGVDQWEPWYQQAFRIIQNHGRGLISTGAREWRDYAASARVTVAKFRSGGLAVRVQGLRRFYALLLVEGGKVQLLKALDGDRILAERTFDWEIWRPYEMRLEVVGEGRLCGWIDGHLVIEAEDRERPLSGGGVGLVVEHGHMATPWVKVCSVDRLLPAGCGP